MFLRHVREGMISSMTDPNVPNNFLNEPREALAFFDSAQRFMFQPGTWDAIDQLAAQMRGSPDYLARLQSMLFPPFRLCWVEAEDFGVFWSGYIENERIGSATGVCRSERGASDLDMWRGEVNLDEPLVPWRPLKVSSYDELRDLGATHEYAERFMARMKDQRPFFFDKMLACFALLATKGMTESVEVDMGKVNKHRARKGLYPLMSFTEIRLNLDVQRQLKAHHGTRTGMMALHPVRAHLRLLATGKVVIVKAHMRGNPAAGTRHHSYTVGRDEDFRG